MTHQQLAELRTLWETRLGEFRASGQSAPEWCAAQHLNVKQFHYWKRKFLTETPPSETPTSVRPQWVPVVLQEPGDHRSPGLRNPYRSRSSRSVPGL